MQVGPTKKFQNMSMLDAITKRLLSVSEGRAKLVEKRTPKEPRAENSIDVDASKFSFYK